MQTIVKKLSYFPLTLTLAAVISGCDSNTAEIHWTSYGVPHIKANNYTALGKGLGYVMAQDRACNYLDGIITAKGERAKFLGAGINNTNITSDFAYLHLATYQNAKTNFQQLDPRSQALMTGFTKGFNHAVQKNKHYAKECAALVQPIDQYDLYALNQSLNYWAFVEVFLAEIGSAQPTAPSANKRLLNKPDSFLDKMKGSNGWALGKAMTDSGKGMLLSNTHLPHGGKFAWYEAQLTIPDELNVYGSFLPGFVTPALGFNERFAWTHTWTNSTPGSVYTLTPAADQALAYQYGNQVKPLQANNYQISVKQPNGSLSELSRTLYSSHYGPIIEFTAQGRFVSLKDGASQRSDQTDYWLKLALSQNVDDAIALNELGYRTGSQNIVMSDDKGNTFYADLASVPDLSATARSIINAVPELRAWGGVLLDGSNPVFEWQQAVPFNQVPQRQSEHYVQNANESPWLVNIENPIVGYSPLYGPSEYPQSPRTRLSVAMLEQFKTSGKKVTLGDLQHTMADKRIFQAELVIEDLIQRCQSYDQVQVNDETVNITQACQVLSNWDKKANIDSVGTHIFREYALQFYKIRDLASCNGQCWLTQFDPQDPVNTPAGLPAVSDPTTDLHLVALAKAVIQLNQANIPLNAPLGNIQSLVKGEAEYPIAGGYGDVTGSFSTVADNMSQNPANALTEKGYRINVGDSFIFLAEFTNQGVNGRSVLLYSQSNNPNSPHYFDQAPLIEGAQYKPIRFKQTDILTDEDYRFELVYIK
ncbi:penicillin acylase family protein [Motilimonas cestriensis]|uniref:Penicillin acylase family protein n=1 Tax=Motilimonas cestriensis TaxID=2742685 RepID=A0ABS8WFA3_9GAMM|nr:penicillin acylase family protein [Motilimonas cestriensis]MCE2596373.1 penicillin acylase family protein [Motilimonas cestriensis]